MYCSLDESRRGGFLRYILRVVQILVRIIRRVNFHPNRHNGLRTPGSAVPYDDQRLFLTCIGQ